MSTTTPTPTVSASRSSYFDKYYPDRNSKGKAPESSRPTASGVTTTNGTGNLGLGLALGRVKTQEKEETKPIRTRRTGSISNLLAFGLGSSSSSSSSSASATAAGSSKSTAKAGSPAGLNAAKGINGERRPSAASFVLEQSLDALKVSPLPSRSASTSAVPPSPPLPFDPPSSNSTLRSTSKTSSRTSPVLRKPIVLPSTSANLPTTISPPPGLSSETPPRAPPTTYLPSNPVTVAAMNNTALDDDFDIPPAVPRPRRPGTQSSQVTIRKSTSFSRDIFPSIVRPGSRPASVYSFRGVGAERDSDTFSISSRQSVASSTHRPISTVFPSSPRKARSVASFQNSSSSTPSDSSLASQSSSYRSLRSSSQPRSADDLDDLFAGPEPIRLRFDETNGAYVATYPGHTKSGSVSAGSAEELDELADMVELMGAVGPASDDSNSLSPFSNSHSPFRRQPRSREVSGESTTSATSDLSFESNASMTAGPTPAQIVARHRAMAAAAALANGGGGGVGGGDAPASSGMERGDTLKPGDPGTSVLPYEDPQTLVPSAPSIDDIVRSYKPHGIPRRTSSLSHRSLASLSSNANADVNPNGPVVFSIPPRNGSLTPSLRSASSNQGSPPASPSLAYSPAVFSTPMSSPRPPSPEIPKPKLHIKTIEEIILEHAGASFLNKPPAPKATPAEEVVEETRARVREQSRDTHKSTGSVDSISEEVSQTLKNSPGLGQSMSRKPSSGVLDASPMPANGGDLDARSLRSSTTTPRNGGSSPSTMTPEKQQSLAVDRELAKLLKSARLTRLLTLRRHPNAGLQVSLADVGCSTGHPVVVFLGLGCVRYLIALYDEIAIAFNLRLICLDRWGLGRTGTVADEKRGFVEWASVVGEVVDQLGISKFSILAHSAGGPYALASSLWLPGRVQGSIHLLAPWVSASADSLAGAYKYLKYVPTGVLKTAQAAEWKVQAWRLGKPPTIVHAPIGYNHRAGISSADQQQATSTSTAPTSPTLGVGSDEEEDVVSVSEFGGSTISDAANSSISTSTLSTASFNGRGSISGRSVKSKSSRSFMGGMFGGGGGGGGGGVGSRTPKSSMGSEAGSPLSSSTLLRNTPPPPSSSSRTQTPPNGSLSGKSSRPTRRGSIASNASSQRTAPGAASAAAPFELVGGGGGGITTVSGTDLANGLLQASHAESLKGSTSDLMVILERTSKPAGFKYADVKTEVKIWWGDKDDRISLSSVKTLEKEMVNCHLKIVEGADHSLMTNGRVVLEVLQSIAADWA